MLSGRMSTDELVSYIQQRWGASALRIAADCERLTTLPTDVEALDGLLGGGLPVGRITTLRGKPTSGATTIAYLAAAAAQRREYVPVYVDAAHVFDPPYAERLGIDLARLTIIRPDDLPETFSIVPMLARSSGFDLIVLDLMGLEYPASELSSWLGGVTTLLHSANTALLVLASPQFGGRALAHYSSVILAVGPKAWLGGERVSVTLSSLKNKTGAPLGSAELELCYSERAVLRKEVGWLAGSLRADTGL